MGLEPRPKISARVVAKFEEAIYIVRDRSDIRPRHGFLAGRIEDTKSRKVHRRWVCLRLSGDTTRLANIVKSTRRFSNTLVLVCECQKAALRVCILQCR